MALGSQLGSILTRLARSRTARRAARDLGRSAVEAIQGRQDRGNRAGDAPADGRSPREAGGHAALADRSSSPAPSISYSPSADGDADPGEIVWSWVPFEEDMGKGKDRPVLVLALEDAAVGGQDGSGQVVIGLMLTSRDRGHGTHTDAHGSTYVDIGTGAWDREQRPSEVRVDRLLRLPASAVRREGASIDRSRFETVVAETGRVHGWR